MTEHDYVDCIDSTSIKDTNYVSSIDYAHYVYIVFDTNVEYFEEVFCGIFATKESAENEADKIADKLYDGDRAHRNHIKVRKEKVR